MVSDRLIAETDTALPDSVKQSALHWATLQKPLLLILSVILIGILLSIAMKINNLSPDDVFLIDSTIGELAIWMAEQTEEEELESPLAHYAQNRAEQRGEETLDPSILLHDARNLLLIWTGFIIIGIAVSAVLLFVRPGWSRWVFLGALLSIDTYLFTLPVLDGDPTRFIVIMAIVLVLIVLLLSPGKITKVLGFFVVLSTIFVFWETTKAVAEAIDYRVTIPQTAWQYATFPSLDEALAAVDNAEVDVILFDRRDLRDLMAAYPPDDGEAIDPTTYPYPTLRYLNDMDRTMGVLFLPTTPGFPGRLRAAVRAEDVDKWTSVGQLLSENVGTVAGEFADTNYLSEARRLVLLDLKIFNDLNLPHLQSIAEALLQPARRNGSQLLVRILADAGLFTLGEAVFGFLFGAALGFLLGTLFAHSSLMERGLLPYVVASQTVPILAIAPMVVIWLGASSLSVSVIAAYLTFFPVTINTLRGLQSPQPMAFELMQSYAATRWDMMWKLRFPAAIPYIFTALKVSATASVVGAIIGELPSGIGDGLGRAILDFSSDYSLVSTPKLWAAIVMASFAGILFFVSVSVAEYVLARRFIREA